MSNHVCCMVLFFFIFETVVPLIYADSGTLLQDHVYKLSRPKPPPRPILHYGNTDTGLLEEMSDYW